MKSKSYPCIENLIDRKRSDVGAIPKMWLLYWLGIDLIFINYAARLL